MTSFDYSNHNNHPIPVIQETPTTQLQHQTEAEVRPYFVNLLQLNPSELQNLQQIGYLSASTESTTDDNDFKIRLLTDKHQTYVSQVWTPPQNQLPSGFVSLNASRPWILYWCLHSHDLLSTKSSIPESDRQRMLTLVKNCWSEIELELSRDDVQGDAFLQSQVKSNSNSILTAGGFGGGPGQLAHAATTYAAVLALCILATLDDTKSTSQRQALEFLIHIRPKLYPWMLALQDTDTGAYRMHDGGEIDVRASYCVLCVAKLLQLPLHQLASPKVVNFIASCQTYEGGLGGVPFAEAHGGYTFCGVAALALVDQLDQLNTDTLLGWLTRRQCSYEGGFAGRAEKLVDGCYSFWQGAALSIVSSHFLKNPESDPDDDNDQTFFLGHAQVLERYILLCAQEPKGGLRDKPSKPRDFYHTCYNLSGLSIVLSSQTESEQCFGHPSNQEHLGQTHPLYNIRVERVQKIQELLSKVDHASNVSST